MTSTRARVRSVAAALTAAATIATLSIASAQPALADTNVSLSGVSSSGLIGVPQTLTVTAAAPDAPCGSILPPAASIFTTVVDSPVLVGQGTFTRCVGSAFQFSFQWLPGQLGPQYVTAQVLDGSSNAMRSAISPVTTTTRITAASTVQVGVPTTVTASVTANNGSLASPQGTIQFSIQGGGNIGSPVALNNAVPSTVQIQWVPAVPGQANLVATYAPTPVNGAILTTCGSTCASAPDRVQVTGTGVNMYLANPPTFTVGQPNTITAVISVVPPSGSVRFTVNGSVIANNVPVQANGQAQATWTPPTAGQFTIGANWFGNGGLTAGAQDVVTAGTAPAQADRITVAPQGQGAWSPSATYTLGNGTSITFTTSTASGAPVTLTAPGPCGINGNTLTVPVGNGTCRLVANSPGGNGFGAAQATYSITLVPGTQRPRGTIPASGNIRRNTTITLATRANNVTNAGQRMKWSVTSGSNRCQLQYPSNGSVRLRARSNGNCNVRATAPAISGQWNRMVVNRTYRVR